MPYQFLLHSDGRADPVNPHAVSMKEFVRAHVPKTRGFAGPVQLSPHARVGVRQSADLYGPGKNPVAVRRKLCRLLPDLELVKQLRRNRQGFSGFIGFQLSPSHLTFQKMIKALPSLKS